MSYYTEHKKKCPKCDRLIDPRSAFCGSHRIITKETINKIKLAKKKNNIIYFSKETREKNRLLMIGNKHALGYKHTNEEKIKIKEKRAKQIMPPCSEEKKKKIGDANRGKLYSPKTTFKNGHDVRRVFKGTKIELKIEQELIKKNVVYKRNVYISNIANVDFYLPKHNIIIECDGDYWHNLPGMKEKDAIKTQKFIKSGYKVFRFWEHDINKSAKECIDSINF